MLRQRWASFTNIAQENFRANFEQKDKILSNITINTLLF